MLEWLFGKKKEEEPKKPKPSAEQEAEDVDMGLVRNGNTISLFSSCRVPSGKRASWTSLTTTAWFLTTRMKTSSNTPLSTTYLSVKSEIQITCGLPFRWHDARGWTR